MTMKKRMQWVMALALACTLMPATVRAQATGDEAAVTQAAMNYLEGFYEGDAEKIRSGVHPDVVKYGFMATQDGRGYRGTGMSFGDMIEFADRVKRTGDVAPESAAKEVILLEVLDQTASAKVIAWWGTDYLHLAKYEGQWKIIHVLWQTPPPS